ncbi:hypothetical protein T265_06011 [Opisthorchis viverrini]|uniref:Uncharacterized protein n=1 Tax=Opisthorchis viverrini TaxID=6198 RepID=A0A074ZM11_OPIVI|nr:hypothetical protein T265_06011 [Opisthorchis viverrini]KER26797.1 hypothetical protein T265_06011 [Opisthorchis viverrini]
MKQPQGQYFETEQLCGAACAMTRDKGDHFRRSKIKVRNATPARMKQPQGQYFETEQLCGAACAMTRDKGDNTFPAPHMVHREDVDLLDSKESRSCHVLSFHWAFEPLWTFGIFGGLSKLCDT